MSQSPLLVKPRSPSDDGLVHRITAESAGWTYVGFETYTLKPGQGYSLIPDKREHCLVLLSGKADVLAGDLRAEGLGERMAVSEHIKPQSVYVPVGTAAELTAITDVELAVCSAPGGGDYPARVIAGDDVGYSVRGEGSNTRYIYDILPDSVDWAHSLLVVEVRTPSGNWSSYPPHRHDEDDMPRQSLLEETYYHRIFPEQGFAFQRVYTDDGSLDEAMALSSGDVVLVPRGYHPYGVAHGYEGYYLNVMAGPKRVWKFYNNPDHEWLMK
ncbi:MAG: 5-deoxy-glucuronate isomerase [Granulosicoccaceae bacterium]